MDNNKKRGFIHKEIIQQLDQTWDFAEFDNWDFDSTYVHNYQPDGIVEMIIMVWRNISNEFPQPTKSQIFNALDFGAFASLGGTSFTVDNGARTIETNFWPFATNPGGSGVTIPDQVLTKNLWITIHEFAHYLMGGNEYHVGYGFWGMLKDWGAKSQVVNSFERARLGWINVIEVNNSPSQTIYNATLPDYVTTGVVYRMNIDPASNQFFYIENHQNLDYWENNLVFGNVENGLYVLRQDGYIGNDVQIIPADGRFSWTVNQVIPNPWGSGDLPVFKNLGPDRVNGYHDLQYIPWVWNGQNQTATPIHFTENENGQPVEDLRFSGDGRDAFRIGFNEMFSPWSNPNSYNVNRTSTLFGFKINSSNNGVFSIDIYVGTNINGPPAKPQNLKLSIVNYHPFLNWDANLEPDLDGYYIYRTENSNPVEQIAYIPKNDWRQGYIDTEVSTIVQPDNISYTIKAKDTSSLLSVNSEKVSVMGILMKPHPETEFKMLQNNYSLTQNYPNPFNPSTEIKYTLKKDGFVTIKVYDVLGRVVATLVNENKPSGFYTVNFNASKLSSGIYFYTIKSNNFFDSKKMILLR